MNAGWTCVCVFFTLYHISIFRCLTNFIPFHKKYASLPELFSRDAVLEELGVLPEDIQGVKLTLNLELAGQSIIMLN